MRFWQSQKKKLLNIQWKHEFMYNIPWFTQSKRLFKAMPAIYSEFIMLSKRNQYFIYIYGENKITNNELFR